MKHKETTKEIVRGGMANIVGRNTKREGSKAKPKSKLQALNEEPKPVRQEFLTKRDNSATGRVTGTRNYRAKGIVKRTIVTTEPEELLKVRKRLFNKISSNYQFSLNRLKPVFLRKKEAYFESIPCKKNI